MRTRVLAALAGVVAALGGGEVVARLYLGLGDPVLYVTHPTIEYMMAPGQTVLRFGNRVHVNGYGMRSAELPAAGGKDCRVMVFGDSVLNGGALTDQSALATERLRDALAETVPAPVTVGNISAGSWGPGNWLAYVQTYGFFDADAVILLISSHDIADVPSFAPLDPDTHPQTRPVSALGEAVTRYLPRYLPAVLRKPPGPDPEQPGLSREAARDLDAFLRLAKAAVARVTVVQWLERDELDGPIKPGHAAIRQIAEAAGADVLSLEDAQRAARAAGIGMFRDNIHPDDSGQQVIAAALADLPGLCSADVASSG